jgi:hypothetical protein
MKRHPGSGAIKILVDTEQACSSMISGLILTMVGAIFLFGLNGGILAWALIVPVGVSILLNAFLPG